MNVAFDPWIPVTTATGKPNLASLCSVLTEGAQYSDLAVRPHERVSLMRLFLCVAHAALNGPKNYNEWCDAPTRLPDAVLKYLTEWKGSFELFHETRPWLQVAGLLKNKDGSASSADTKDWAPVSKLSFSFATGNNTTLFDHEGMAEDRRIPLNATLVSMLAFQCFSPGGLISQVYWNGVQSEKSSKDGPAVPASMVHAFLRGENLGETIHRNLPTHNDIRLTYGDRDIGRPVWEMPPASWEDSDKVQNATATYLGRLAPMTRAIRLHPSGERMLLGNGLVYPSFTDSFPPEPTATVVIKKTGGKEDRGLLSYRPTKALWRELTALVAKRSADGAGGPLTLRTLQEGESCDLIVAALARDQATIVDTIESVFHVPSALRLAEGTAAYEAEVKTAETMASRLGWAVETYRKEIDHGWEGRLKSAGPKKGELQVKLHSLATTHYWTTVEKNLSLLMNHIEAIGTDEIPPTREAWRKMLFAAACEAYRLSCGQATPRQMRAFIKGWQKLTAQNNPAQPDTHKDKEEN